MKKLANTIRAQLCDDMLRNIEDEEVFIASLLHTSSYFELLGAGNVALTYETNLLILAKRIFSFLKQFSSKCEIKVEKQKNKEIKKIKIIVPYTAELETFCKKIRIDMFEVRNLDFVMSDAALSAYIKGVFLSCGYLENYHDRYFLEFYFQTQHYSDIFFNLYNRIIPDLKKRCKKNKYAVFTQTKKGVEAFLNVSNATKTFFKLLDSIIIKEIKAGVNRKTNFEFANLDRMSDAFHKFKQKYQKFLKNDGNIEDLSSKIREIVILRKEFPELSLSQLGSKVDRGMKKSTVNYWLNKFYKIVEEM